MQTGKIAPKDESRTQPAENSPARIDKKYGWLFCYEARVGRRIARKQARDERRNNRKK